MIMHFYVGHFFTYITELVFFKSNHGAYYYNQIFVHRMYDCEIIVGIVRIYIFSNPCNN